MVCGDSHDEGSTVSDEHVFPEWLLHEFELWDERFRLQNGTLIPYRQVKIPVCQGCNSEALARLETSVCDAYRRGPEAVRALGPRALGTWMAKILLGLLVLELRLPVAREDPGAGTIIEDKDLDSFILLRLMVRGAATPIELVHAPGDTCASVYVFDLKEPESPALRFDFADFLNPQCLCLRLGRVGVSAVFDLGIEGWAGRPTMEPYYGTPIHRIQFAELTAQMFESAAGQIARPPLAYQLGAEAIRLVAIPSASGDGSTHGEWDDSRYAEILARLLRVKVEDVLLDGKPQTWLRDEYGDIRDIAETD